MHWISVPLITYCQEAVHTWVSCFSDMVFSPSLQSLCSVQQLFWPLTHFQEPNEVATPSCHLIQIEISIIMWTNLLCNCYLYRFHLLLIQIPDPIPICPSLHHFLLCVYVGPCCRLVARAHQLHGLVSQFPSWFSFALSRSSQWFESLSFPLILSLSS